MDLTKLGLAEKERKILEAAIDVFSEKGFSGATTNEIAKRAGVAEGTIFRYFKTKKDLLRGILIQMLNLLGEPVIMEGVRKILLQSEEKEMRRILKALILDRMELINSVFPMVRIVITEALYHEDIRDAFFQNVLAKGIEIFSIFHQQMVVRGMIRPDVDPLAMGRSIVGNIALFVIFRRFFAEKFSPTDMERDLDQVIDIIMFGIAGEASREQK
ncbi:MAG: TetR/AcrR family transcriptional regulator [Proteobacteria bacterium]|nr:TetR/AcrR family transcriptional regulator [Pseudomonadota bacterium]